RTNRHTTLHYNATLAPATRLRRNAPVAAAPQRWRHTAVKDGRNRHTARSTRCIRISGVASFRCARASARCGANPCSISTFPCRTARLLLARHPWPRPECQIGRTPGFVGLEGAPTASLDAEGFCCRPHPRDNEACASAKSAKSGRARRAACHPQRQGWKRETSPAGGSPVVLSALAMRFPNPVLRGTLIQRYKRFLADVHLDDGRLVTATCPNTGSMLGLTSPGATVWLSENASPTRKYRFTWEMVEADLGHGPTLVGINTQHPNLLVAEAMSARRIKLLVGYPGFRREVRYGENSRIDILLECAKKGLCYVEVKNVHLSRRHGLAEFPDSVTARGTKHLRELTNMVRAGHRAVMLFLIQRGDAKKLALARDVDADYGAAFDVAVAAGVETIALRCRLTSEEIVIDKSVPIAG